MKMYVHLFKGFKFGMLLQLSVGPICLYIFQTASEIGLLQALAGVLGVVCMDALFIAAAVFGISKFIESKKVLPLLRIFGALVLLLFGLHVILSVFYIHLLPGFTFDGANSRSSFLYALILTASNPLTILFWAGVFSSKVAEERLPRNSVAAYGLGAALSTLLFLSFVAFLGSLVTALLPSVVIRILNAAVGALLIGFGVKTLLKKKEHSA